MLTNDGQKKGQHAKMQVGSGHIKVLIMLTTILCEGCEDEARGRQEDCGHSDSWLSHGATDQDPWPGGRGVRGDNPLRLIATLQHHLSLVRIV